MQFAAVRYTQQNMCTTKKSLDYTHTVHAYIHTYIQHTQTKLWFTIYVATCSSRSKCTCTGKAILIHYTKLYLALCVELHNIRPVLMHVADIIETFLIYTVHFKSASWFTNLKNISVKNVKWLDHSFSIVIMFIGICIIENSMISRVATRLHFGLGIFARCPQSLSKY